MLSHLSETSLDGHQWLDTGLVLGNAIHASQASSNAALHLHDCQTKGNISNVPLGHSKQ